MDDSLSPYLRLIGRIANTRHPGGLNATRTLLEKTGINQKWQVLDLGCGAGHTSAYLAQKYGCQVHGIDISDDALNNARELYKDEPYFNKINFQKSDIHTLPFSQNYFDLVLCESVLLFSKDKLAALQEISRVLNHQGFLVLNELCANKNQSQALIEHFAKKELKAYLCEPKNLKHILKENGFETKTSLEAPLKLSSQIKADWEQFGNLKGLYQVLEFAHQMLTNEQARHDLWQVLKFLMNMPEGIKNLISLKILAQKI